MEKLKDVKEKYYSLDDEEKTVSATECTGLIPANPADFKKYKDVFLTPGTPTED